MGVHIHAEEMGAERKGVPGGGNCVSESQVGKHAVIGSDLANRSLEKECLRLLDTGTQSRQHLARPPLSAGAQMT